MKIVLCLSILGYQLNFALAKTAYYVYREKNVESKKFFLELLPKEIQNIIQSTYPNFDYITSCSGDLLPELGDEFLYAVVESNKKTAHIFVARLDANKKVIMMPIQLSKQLPLDGPDDYYEIYCKPTRYFGNKTTSFDVKTQKMDGIHSYAYDSKSKKFKLANEIYPD